MFVSGFVIMLAYFIINQMNTTNHQPLLLCETFSKDVIHIPTPENKSNVTTNTTTSNNLDIDHSPVVIVAVFWIVKIIHLLL